MHRRVASIVRVKVNATSGDGCRPGPEGELIDRNVCPNRCTPSTRSRRHSIAHVCVEANHHMDAFDRSFIPTECDSISVSENETPTWLSEASGW